MKDNPAPSTASPQSAETSRHGPAAVGWTGFAPALFSAYRDLAKLRYDYPVVLVEDGAAGAYVRSLRDIIDGVLRDVAPRGIDGERLRKHVLALEEKIRTSASRGAKGSLTRLWDMAETALLSGAGKAARKDLRGSIAEARAALDCDGEVLDCDAETPARMLIHAWATVQESKAHASLHEIGTLVLKLSDILKSDSLKSKRGKSANALKRSIGTAYEKTFDFEALSRILTSAGANTVMGEKRARRIRSALSVLKSQRFIATGDGTARHRNHGEPYDFVFHSCARALAAFRERLPEMAKLVEAMAIAELEIENKYNAAVHDPFFDRPGEGFLEPEDLEMFPAYVVCLPKGLENQKELAAAVAALSSGLPFKILVQNEDILADLPIGSGQLAFGAHGSQPALMALGLRTAFVLQAPGSTLYALRDSILAGMAHSGPAVFSVFPGHAGKPPGPAKNTPAVAPYLRAAAAAESRAFPAFVYDPAAGGDLAARFSLAGNPQPQAAWPAHRLDYEDHELQRASEDAAFTFVDFVAADARYRDRFTVVPRSEWHDGMVPVSTFLELENGAAPQQVPYILVTGENNVLHRATVDDGLLLAARRCRETWKNLQEMGGINNSHARRLLEQEKENWEREKAREIAALTPQPGEISERPAAAGAEAAATDSAEAAAVEMEAAVPGEAGEAVQAAVKPPDGAYIETPRCTTCNECTDINNRMFAYDGNEQAFIADVDAGTYRQLVEASESCQVAIIHPGLPRNPNEPGLDDLIARAAPFN